MMGTGFGINQSAGSEFILTAGRGAIGANSRPECTVDGSGEMMRSFNGHGNRRRRGHSRR